MYESELEVSISSLEYRRREVSSISVKLHLRHKQTNTQSNLKRDTSVRLFVCLSVCAFILHHRVTLLLVVVTIVTSPNDDVKFISISKEMNFTSFCRVNRSLKSNAPPCWNGVHPMGGRSAMLHRSNRNGLDNN